MTRRSFTGRNSRRESAGDPRTGAADPPDPDERIVCVLGMHRSGTSCLTGSLQLAGLDLGGNHSTWNPHNRRGNRENPEINDFHDDLLASNGGSWDDPPERVEWKERHVRRARRIVADYPSDRRWGFKDPKTLTAIEGWRELLGPLCRVGIFRDPVLVARSLWRRNTMPFDRAVDLWIHYNARLLREWERRPFPLLSFDLDGDAFHSALNRALPEIGLEPLATDTRFFTAELRHDASDEPDRPPLPVEARTLYRKLRERAVRPDPDD